ncbi:DGQHR domain-containing protein [Variovorax beijingensis]|uniref:DGQHR domain-containing protein n=1 Tax=Variovorax beijingensis TaxID=2496117 RepID=A0A561C4D3_9BURK|nr:DGQHR domain-containing protein [Variovorax beijingensis]TWD86059.1 DGQHR domain-containing protein [Variovorax beijingensis]
MPQYNYPAIIYKQRGTAEALFCICTVVVGELRLWARVDRLTPENQQGVQRARKDARVDAIEDFLKVDERNTIPTSIIVALPVAAATFGALDLQTVGTAPQAVTLTITTNEAQPQPGLIIDGQHRTDGIAQFDANMPVNLVTIIGPSDDEIAFQFVVINNKVSKVAAEHIKALKIGYSSANLDARLRKSARMKSSGEPAYLDQIDTQDDSPFRGRLKWPRNEEDPARAIPVNAFEMAMAYISRQRIDQTASSDPNPDFVVRFFIEVWKVVAEKWADAWADPAGKLTTKVGVICMTEFLVEAMVSWSTTPGQAIDLTDLNQVRDLTSAALDQLEPGLWTSEWNAASLDTSSGRGKIVETLKSIQRNKLKGLPWNLKVPLVDSTI